MNPPVDGSDARICILVAGMHRSGTSATARVINLLGADIGSDLMPATEYNERGFWESRVIHDAHDRLLNELGSGWDDPFPLVRGWLDDAATASAEETILRQLEKDFAGSRRFVVKDPRLTRLLPLWLRMLDELRIEPVVVIACRHPLEVAASLARRDELPVAISLLCYIDSYLEVERASRGRTRLFQSYAALLSDWRTFAASLAAAAGVHQPSVEAAEAIDRFLSETLRHHRANDGDAASAPAMASAAIAVYQRMVEAAASGSDDTLRRSFDALRADLSGTGPLDRELIAAQVAAHRLQLVQLDTDLRAQFEWELRQREAAIDHLSAAALTGAAQLAATFGRTQGGGAENNDATLNIARSLRILAERRAGRTLYLCHQAHEHDRIYMENMAEALGRLGVQHRLVEFEHPGNRPELLQCLRNASGLVGINSQLDHCWIEQENLLDAAARHEVPVVHWLVDHPSQRWSEFGNATAENSRFLLVSAQCESYFRRHMLPAARTAWTSGVGPNRRSRLQAMSRPAFLRREINCLIALSVRRPHGSPDDAETPTRALAPELGAAVREAAARALHDLGGPRDRHLEAALGALGRELPGTEFHHCFRILDEMTLVARRLKIFEVARDFPVVVQTDFPPPFLVSAALPTVRTGADAVSMAATAERMQSCRAVLNANSVDDMLHDRTANALNAGCVAIIEDTPLHRSLFTHGGNALLFRYDDDSLAECLDLVCHHPERAYEIAAAGFTLRDCAPFRFGGFHNAFDLTSP